ncbi:hypothetical protein ACFPRL_06560 [Pseudoclavibacter helvolus]
MPRENRARESDASRPARTGTQAHRAVPARARREAAARLRRAGRRSQRPLRLGVRSHPATHPRRVPQPSSDLLPPEATHQRVAVRP